jgi:hypothetical protein
MNGGLRKMGEVASVGLCELLVHKSSCFQFSRDRLPTALSGQIVAAEEYVIYTSVRYLAAVVQIGIQAGMQIAVRIVDL